MEESKKRQFDALHALSEQFWRDWEIKSRAEWRLSFGIWAALLAAAATVGKADVKVGWVIASMVGVSALLVHINFLRWIQHMLTVNRSEMHKCQKQMSLLVSLDWSVDPRKHWIKQVSLWSQASITAILVFILIVVSLQLDSTSITAENPRTPPSPTDSIKTSSVQ